ncbi:MAG TPA: NADH-quinone oxidoreductase subunit C [Candidatus Dormibacteraeota bacterium]|nr:NADH-quinone oxidoreductase subunit C [Candidatus Dormibacteraeota bacterium]
MSRLAELAPALGLTPEAGPPGELRAVCASASFTDLAARIAVDAHLSDLFASVNPEGVVLTAVFSLAGDPDWLLLSTLLSGDRFPSLTPRVHAASWYEREIAEMYGLVPEHHPAPVRLRLHDWPEGMPPMRCRLAPGERAPRGERPEVVPEVRGQGVFQLPLGPVRSGPQEAAEFLFNSGGEDLVAVWPRLGYKLRLVERLAEGRPVEAVLALAERLAGTSTFSNGLAFVQAVERAAAVEVPPAARLARTLLNELERLHHHFGAVGRVADATGLLVAAAQYAMLKEEVLRTCAALTGHRYSRGILAPGGLAAPLAAEGMAELAGRLPDWRRRAAGLGALLEDTATFMDRLEGTAVLEPGYAAQHDLVGPIGRSTGVDRDVRRDHPYAAYAELAFEVPTDARGDAEARVRVLLAEIGQSLGIVQQALDRAPAPSAVPPDAPLGAGSALGWAEAPGGETLHFIELDAGGRVRRWRARPPACVNWHPYAHACASGNNLTDYPVIEASFALSHAELDR